MGPTTQSPPPLPAPWGRPLGGGGGERGGSGSRVWVSRPAHPPLWLCVVWWENVKISIEIQVTL